jgi:AAA15 family ATPase/GTPase
MSFVKKIRIQNFKSLKDFEIEMKPLMFLFGANSSGKSSFIKALSFLSKNIFPISDNGVNFKLSEQLNLQNYSQTVHNGDNSLNIEYCIDINIPLSRIYPWHKTIFFGKKKPEISNNDFQVIVEFCSSYNKQVVNEFSSSYNNSAEISKIIVIDKTNNITFKYTKGTYSWGIEIISDNINIEPFEKYFGINQKDKNFFNYRRVIPFKDLSIKETQIFLNYICEYFKNTHNIKEEQLSEWNFWKDEGADYLKLLRIFASIYYEIPNALSCYLNNIYIPGIREIPKERYTLGGDRYLLGNNKFDDSDYYNLLNSLYDHQKSIVSVLNKREDDNKYIDKYVTLFKKADFMLSNFTKIQLQEVTDIFNDLIGTKYKDIISHIKNNMEYLGANQNSGLPKFINLTNKEKEYYLFLYDANNKIESHEAKGNHQPDHKDNLSILTNTSIIVNHIINKLGFDSIIYLTKDDGYGKLLSIKNNKKDFYINNESSGYLQLLPFLFALVKIYASTHYRVMTDPHISRSESDDNGYFIYNNEERALYIEQPELHLHPKLQANIVEAIIDIVNEFNDFNSLIIETHSEHIIKKVQVEVAKGNISNENVGVYFFKKKNNISSSENIKINVIGQLEKEFPEGFFDDSLNLTYEFYDALKNRN